MRWDKPLACIQELIIWYSYYADWTETSISFMELFESRLLF